MLSASLRRNFGVAAIALSAWAVPLLWSLRRERTARTPSGAYVGAPTLTASAAQRPLILYVDAWPTRAKLDLREIQGLTTESPSSLAPAQVADDLMSALGRLGVTPEIHRIDRLPAAVDLSLFRPVVIVYPARHGRPSPEVSRFFDGRIEPLVAAQDGRTNISLMDAVVGEDAAAVEVAQRALGAMSHYYGLRYEQGPQLTPGLSLQREREILDRHAQRIQSEARR